jgi:DNA-binding NarL/FixJ family response regulator
MSATATAPAPALATTANGSPATATPARSSGQAPAEGLLSEQEHLLLVLLCRGLPEEAIARRLLTSSRTVRRRIRALCDRLGVRTPLQAAVWAARRGLV